MTATVISTNTIAAPPAFAADADSLLVLATGSIVAPDQTILGLATLNNTVSILGFVEVHSVSLAGSDIVTIGATGTLIAGDAAIDLGVDAFGKIAGGSQVVNFGIVSGTIGVNVAGIYNRVVNNGTIIATASAMQDLIGSQNLFENHGTITTLGTSIGMSGSQDSFSNSGSVASSAGTAIFMGGLSQTFVNTGAVQSFSSTVTFSRNSLSGTGSVINKGSLVSLTEAAVIVAAGFSDIQATIENTGTMFGATNGIWTPTGEDIVLRNSGAITADTGAGVKMGAVSSLGTATITNLGTITGKTASLDLADGADKVVNKGHLLGDVLLGAGSDTFDGRGGTVVGSVYGGDGGDTYLISDAGLDLVEGAGLVGDKDVVKSTVSYQLAANFEILTLLGSQDLNGTGNVAGNTVNGNAGDNRLSGLGGFDTLMGNAGDDRLLGGLGNDNLFGGDGDDALIGGGGKDGLNGGAGADRFIFQTPGNTGATEATADTIVDFTQGEDVIDLSQIDAIRFNTDSNDVFSFIDGTPTFSAAGQVRFAFSGTNTLVLLETNGDNVADAVIKLTGHLTLNASDFLL
jgi:Ca2+-binding RTX toxin-like protein